ncbi:MAG: diguanylate cyclase [Planctomycetota bacterium]|nr:MAG: diguanylate cyclase [Planctomycetota bacterium]
MEQQIPVADSESERAPAGRWRIPLTWSVGALLACAAFVASQSFVARELRTEFERRALDLHAGLVHRLSGDLDTLHALRGLFDCSESVSSDEFRRFADDVLDRHPSVQSLHYAELPRTDGPALRHYDLARAGAVEFVGGGLHAHALMQRVLGAAREGGQPVASEPLCGADPERRVIGVALATRGTGFVLGGFDVDALVESNLHGELRDDFAIEVVDVTGAGAGPCRVYAGAHAPAASGLLEDVEVRREGMFAGRPWSFAYRPARGYAVRGAWEPYAIAAGVLALALVSAAYLRGLVQRNRRVERDVRARTRELTRSNERLQSQIRDRRRIERRLRTLIAMTSRQGITRAQRIAELLRFAAGELGLDGAWVARRRDGLRVIEHVFDPDKRIEVGDALRLNASLCGETLRRGQLLALGMVAESPWEEAPEAAEGHISAYVGCPVRLQGEACATFALFSRRGAFVEFELNDLNFAQLVAGWIGQELTELALEEQLAHQATHDALTGVPNRALLHDRAEQALANTLRAGESVGLLYLDLDGFKQVNDELGHAAGDRVLVAVAQRLRPLLREGDTLARLGGDEFAVLLPRMESRAGAELVAERVLAAFAQPFARGTQPTQLGCSIGIAVAPEDGDTVEALMHRADEAMYAAKAAGKNCWRVAEAVA